MGLKKNISYNIILTLSSYIIGFVTFPYISRVLGASNIGVVSFVDNAINYFVLFSTLGAATIGAREIAKHKNDKSKLNTIFSSLIVMYVMYTTIVLVAYFLVITFVDKLRIHEELFYIGTAKLIFSVFLIEWFYKGLENFKYITTRSLLIKLLYVVLVFVFVRKSEDYKIYFILTTLSVVVNSLINIIYARKIVKFSLIGIKLKSYLKQSFFLGSYSLLTSMYTTFNILYLGFVSDTLQVGYYWAALTLYGVMIGVFSAFTGAIMPRMSTLIYMEQTEQFTTLIDKSFNLLFSFCFPVIIGSILLAPQIIGILSGPGFEGAIIPMKIIMPLIIVVGIAQILAIQALIPMQKDKLILIAALVGASVGIMSNLIFVERLGAIGTAIVLLCSELSVTIYYIYIVWKNKILIFPWNILAKNVIFSLPYFLLIYLFLQIWQDNNVLILLSSIIAIISYFFILNIFILKNTDIITIFNSIKIFAKK